MRGNHHTFSNLVLFVTVFFFSLCLFEGSSQAEEEQEAVMKARSSLMKEPSRNSGRHRKVNKGEKAIVLEQPAESRYVKLRMLKDGVEGWFPASLIKITGKKQAKKSEVKTPTSDKPVAVRKTEKKKKDKKKGRPAETARRAAPPDPKLKRIAPETVLIWEFPALDVPSSQVEEANAMLQTEVVRLSGKAAQLSAITKLPETDEGKAYACLDTDADCLSRLGQDMGIAYIVSGQLSSTHKQWIIRLNLIDVRTQKIIASADLRPEKEADNLSPAIIKAAKKLFEKAPL